MATGPIKLNIIKEPYTMISWNVDGYSDVIHEWIKELLTLRKPDILFLSETKKSEHVLRQYFDQFTNYNFIINTHVPAQYHGVAALIRKDRIYQQFTVNLGIPARKDTKDGNPATGRIIAFQFENIYNIIGTYVPNSGINKKDRAEKHSYRINTWDPALSGLLNMSKSLKPTIWMGDINVAANEIDVSHPNKMSNMAGFTPEERANFAQFMKTGWVDIWRMQHPFDHMYSWRGHTPKEGYGLRLDSIIISPEITPRVSSSFMIPDCISSDHIPVGICIYPK